MILNILYWISQLNSHCTYIIYCSIWCEICIYAYLCKIEIIWPYVSYEAKSWSHYSLKPFVCGQGNAGWSTRLLCDQNWPITNASKGPPLAALAKWSQTSALIILRHCCYVLATHNQWSKHTESGEGIMLHKIGGCFLRLPERMENRERPKQGSK